MKRLCLFLGLAVAWLAVAAAPASATVFTDLLTYDGTEDIIQDNSVALALVDGGVVGTLDAGDTIAGLIRWNRNIGNSPTTIAGNTAVTLFSATITGGPAGSTGRTVGTDPALYFTVGPTPAATGLAIHQLLSTFGLAPAPAIGATLSKTGGVDVTTLPFGPPAPAPNALGSLNDGTWALDFTFGMLPGVGGNTQGGTDFFEADVRDRRGPGVDGVFYTLDDTGPDGIISISDTDGDGWVDEWDDFNGAGVGNVMIPGSAVTGYEAGAFSMIVNNIVSPPGFMLPVSASTLTGAPSTVADIGLSPSTTLIQATGAQISLGYQFADQSIYTMNPVPEPSIVVGLASMLALVAGGAFWRRKRKQAS